MKDLTSEAKQILRIRIMRPACDSVMRVTHGGYRLSGSRACRRLNSMASPCYRVHLDGSSHPVGPLRRLEHVLLLVYGAGARPVRSLELLPR
jgi:hypothetical protein